MASTTSDDAFHEIQLNGKQLVFLFMAVVVVSVVIFLCGVLVGRGVRAERGPVDAMSTPAATDVVADAAVSASPSSGSAAANEDLSYPNRLSASAPAPESLRMSDAPRSAPPTPPVARAETAPAAAPVEPAAAAAASPADGSPASSAPVAATSEPAGAGFAIQVAALRQRAEADTVARTLATKGYPAYVINPEAGAPAVFRVRVGKFKDRREAESIAARLTKEEQFKPWIVR